MLVKSTDIEIDGYEKELMIGETMSLTATVVPNNAIDTAEKYVISANDLSADSLNIIYILGGVAILVIGVVAYIVIKKTYWFW